MEILYFFLIAIFTFFIFDKLFNVLNIRKLRILNKIQGFTSRFKRRMVYRTNTGLISLIIAECIIEVFHLGLIGAGVAFGLIATLRKIIFLDNINFENYINLK